jgi:hypothetical protein
VPERGTVTLPMQHAAWALAFAADYAMPRNTGATVVAEIIARAAPQLDADARAMIARDLRRELDPDDRMLGIPPGCAAEWRRALDALEAPPPEAHHG